MRRVENAVRASDTRVASTLVEAASIVGARPIELPPVE